MPQRLKGDRPSVETQWTGSLYDSSYFYNPYMEKYRREENFKLPFFLTPDRHYVGTAWYRRTVEVPADWKNRRVVLYLERPHIETELWVNEKKETVKLWSLKFTLLSLASVFIIPLITMVAFYPGMLAVAHINYVSHIWNFAWITPLVGVSFVVLLTMIIAILKWLLLGNVKEGRYKVNSLFYYKKWFFDQLMKLSLPPRN
jgi:hypothetical protein